jgi:membrane protein YdbS with pleckstrin-like domain
MEPQKVDPAALAAWRCQAQLVVGAFSLAAFSAGTIQLAPLLPGVPPVWLLGPAVAIALAAAWIVPSLHYGALDYVIDEAGIAIRSGVLWRSQVRLPRVRIQHTDVSQGPLERRFGIATLKLYTAGSRYTRIELPGLAHEEALALRDLLIARTGAVSGV